MITESDMDSLRDSDDRDMTHDPAMTRNLNAAASRATQHPAPVGRLAHLCSCGMSEMKEKLSESALDSMDCTKTSSHGASRSLALLNFKEHVHLVDSHALVEAMISSLRKFENSSEREIVLGTVPESDLRVHLARLKLTIRSDH